MGSWGRLAQTGSRWPLNHCTASGFKVMSARLSSGQKFPPVWDGKAVAWPGSPATGSSVPTPWQRHGAFVLSAEVLHQKLL